VTQSPVVLGLDFGGTKIAIAVCDLSGNRVGETVLATQAAAGAASAFDRAIVAARELLAAAAHDRELVAVAAATFGIPFDDRVELAPAIPGWETFAFGRELRAAFPGAVIKGAHGAAGEIGYNVREPADIGKSPAERITLEDVVSGKALVAIADTEFGAETSVAEIFDRATAEPAAARIVDSFTRELAQHVVNLAIAVDPARIAVGGGLARSWAIIAPRLRQALDAAVPFPPDLVLAQFPFDAPLIGALALGVEAAAAVLGEEALR